MDGGEGGESFSIGLYISMAMPLLLSINNYVFVCLVLALFLGLVLLMSYIYVNLEYLVN